MRLLLVEDDRMIGESLCKGLRGEGFAVDWVCDGAAAEAALQPVASASPAGPQAGPHDLVVLDLGLPRKDGITVLENLRRRGSLLPVLILSARDRVPDRVRGLHAGADDYLVKPFDFDELVARIHALARRAAGRSQPLLKHRDLVLDPLARSVTRGDQPVSLSAREFALLSILLENAGRVLSVAQIEDKLYGWNEEVGSNAVEVHIHALRRKLGASLIRNVRGVGYTIDREPVQ